MKNYFFAEVLSSDHEKLFVSDFEVIQNDFVVIDNGYLEPETAKVVKVIDKVKAIASKQQIHEVIDSINMKPYLDKKVAESEMANLVKLMKDEIENVKMLETLDKYAGKSDKMTKLIDVYRTLTKEAQGKGE